jgi:hypothetical protein
MIWRNGVLPSGARAFSDLLSYDLHSYGYAVLGLGLRLRDLGGAADCARLAFEQAATALEFVIAKGNPTDPDRDFLHTSGGFLREPISCWFPFKQTKISPRSNARFVTSFSGIWMSWNRSF